MPVTVQDVKNWVVNARPGAVLIYHDGFLDRRRLSRDKAAIQLNLVANTLLGYAGAHLPQKRRLN